MEPPTGPTEPAGGGPTAGSEPRETAWTRFAPAPTGYLHLGHVANAIYVWGMAAAIGAKVLLRIEDHDRERSGTVYDTAILEDLAWLGFAADAGPVRQHDDPSPYAAAVERLRVAGLVYACDCTRSTFATWSASHGNPWRGPGCPGDCQGRSLVEESWLTLRVALGEGEEAWVDHLLGPQVGPVTLAGDLPIRDREGNWTYALCVVVDDSRQSVSLVIRGEDLAEATPAQIHLARLLGLDEPPRFAHHALLRKADGSKLSKADGDTGVHDLRAAGWSAAGVIGAAAAALGFFPAVRPLEAANVADLVADRLAGR